MRLEPHRLVFVDETATTTKMTCIGLDLIGQLSDLGARLRVSDRSAQQAIATGWLC
jgi:hypothetical protein